MKSKNLIIRVLAIIFAGLMVLPLCLVWLTQKTYIAGRVTENQIKLDDITENVVKMSEKGNMINAAKIIFYIVFALAMLLVVLEVLRFFVKRNKVIDGITKLVGLVMIVLGILTFVFSLVWCNANTNTTIILDAKNGVSYSPWFGGIGTLVFALLGGICALIEKPAKASKKRR